MLNKRTWADEIIINAISIMWQLTVTVVYGTDLRHLRIRHSIPKEELATVSLVLIYSKDNHYSATGIEFMYIYRGGWGTHMYGS